MTNGDTDGNTAEIPSTAVLAFGADRPPALLAQLPVQRAESPTDTEAVDAAIGPHRRLVVVGADAALAVVLSRLLRADRLDVEVAYLPRRRTTATRIYRLPTGRRAARRAQRGSAQRVPLIRDETGSVIVGRALWLPTEKQPSIHGEAVVDDTPLFDGDAAGVRIEPTLAMPGLRAKLQGNRSWPFWLTRWNTGRAAQLGTTGAIVVRDGLASPRAARRSTFYRHVEGWLVVR